MTKLASAPTQTARPVLHGSLPVTFFREGKTYIAYSPVIDLSTAGKTLAVAQKNFSEAAKLFFRELIDRGTLDEVLTDLGWEKTMRGYTPPAVVAHDEFELDYAQNHARSLAHV